MALLSGKHSEVGSHGRCSPRSRTAASGALCRPRVDMRWDSGPFSGAPGSKPSKCVVPLRARSQLLPDVPFWEPGHTEV